MMATVHVVESHPLGQIEVSHNGMAHEDLLLARLGPGIDQDREPFDAHPELCRNQLGIRSLVWTNGFWRFDAGGNLSYSQE